MRGGGGGGDGSGGSSGSSGGALTSYNLQLAGRESGLAVQTYKGWQQRPPPGTLR